MILDILFQLTLLLTLATVASLLFLRKSASARYAVATSVLIVCLLLPPLNFLARQARLSWVNVPVLASEQTPKKQLIEVPVSTDLIPVSDTAPIPIVPREPVRPPAQADLQKIGIGLWTLGLMFVSGRLLIGCRKVSKLKSAANLPLPLVVSGAVEELKTRLGVRKFPEVRVSPDVGTPLAIGIGKPTILLPQGIAESASSADLFAILAHEYAHLDQKHFVSAFVELAALAAYWPHPLIYPVRFELARAREEVSDNFVLQLTSSTEFAKTLLWAAERCQPSPRLPAAAGLVLSGWNLEQRVQGLLDPRRRSTDGLSRFNMTTYLTAAVGACMLLAGVRLSHSQTATIEINQDGKSYVVHVTPDHPATVKVSGTGHNMQLKVDGKGEPGTYVVTSSGKPGKAHVVKVLRMKGSKDHHDPTIVLDGVPGTPDTFWIGPDSEPQRLKLDEETKSALRAAGKEKISSLWVNGDSEAPHVDITQGMKIEPGDQVQAWKWADDPSSNRVLEMKILKSAQEREKMAKDLQFKVEYLTQEQAEKQEQKAEAEARAAEIRAQVGGADRLAAAEVEKALSNAYEQSKRSGGARIKLEQLSKERAEELARAGVKYKVLAEKVNKIQIKRAQEMAQKVKTLNRVRLMDMGGLKAGRLQLLEQMGSLRKSLAIAKERAMAENHKDIAEQLQRIMDQLKSEGGH